MTNPPEIGLVNKDSRRSQLSEKNFRGQSTVSRPKWDMKVFRWESPDRTCFETDEGETQVSARASSASWQLQA